MSFQNRVFSFYYHFFCFLTLFCATVTMQPKAQKLCGIFIFVKLHCNTSCSRHWRTTYNNCPIIYWKLNFKPEQRMMQLFCKHLSTWLVSRTALWWRIIHLSYFVVQVFDVTNILEDMVITEFVKTYCLGFILFVVKLSIQSDRIVCQTE